ncbi:hypothetical protein B0I35DRAFT_423516 [Stachybotrys elegans]|uniref:Uncharacterized protein n=1 Tax=Stachybotrys elegans TaxID=80388 RepID=A0A8K0SX20_9HYPO|nr:hypothetical protein B0I35DRAFT_423516 [Stachybotrys elegans]
MSVRARGILAICIACRGVLECVRPHRHLQCSQMKWLPHCSLALPWNGTMKTGSDQPENCLAQGTDQSGQPVPTMLAC